MDCKGFELKSFCNQETQLPAQWETTKQEDLVIDCSIHHHVSAYSVAAIPPPTPHTQTLLIDFLIIILMDSDASVQHFKLLSNINKYKPSSSNFQLLSLEIKITLNNLHNTTSTHTAHQTDPAQKL